MAKTHHIRLLFQALSQKTGAALDWAGFQIMSDVLDDSVQMVSRRYLNDTYKDILSMIDRGISDSRHRVIHLNVIAQYLGYDHFDDFSRSCESELDPIVASVCGNWWSYVKSSDGSSILKAPVKIYRDSVSGALKMNLEGKERQFRGTIEEKGNCLTGFLDSGTGKRIGLVFKLGESLHIDLLQGVFCGVSTTGHPIAGREILIREKSGVEMKWEKLKTNDQGLHPSVQSYFKRFDDNICVNNIKGFGEDDL